MKRFFLILSLMVAVTISVCSLGASAQQQLLTANCNGDITHDTAWFTTTKTAVGAVNEVTFQLPFKVNPAQRCKITGPLTLTANITLDNSVGSGIDVASGVLTVAGPRVNPIGKTMFFGSGTVTLTGRGYDSLADATNPGLVTTTTSNSQAVSTNDVRVTADQATNVASIRTLGDGALQAVAGTNTRIPTQSENDALAGTNGTSSGVNRFVTDSDPRNADQRIPSDNSVSTVKMIDDSVTTPKIADGAVTFPQVDPAYPANFLLDPSKWPKREHLSNPVFSTSAGAGKCVATTASGRMTDTVPIYLSGTTIITFTREVDRINKCDSTNGGATWSNAGMVLTLGTAGQWDDTTINAFYVSYSTADGVVKLWYEGTNSASVRAIGYATCSADTAATTCTKFGSNPILTAAQMQSAMGFGGAVIDLGINTVWRSGSTYFFATFGYTAANEYKAGIWTSTSPTTLTYHNTPFAFTNRIEALSDVWMPTSNSNYLIGFVTDGMLANTVGGDPADWRSVGTATSLDGGYTWTLNDPFGTWLQPPGSAGGSWYGTKVSNAKWLKDPSDPNNLTLKSLSGENQVYFSGFNLTTPIQAGIMYTQPGLGSTPRISCPAGENIIPCVRLRNTVGAADAMISGRSDASGADMLVGSNMQLLTNASQGSTISIPDLTQPGISLLFSGAGISNQGTASFLAANVGGTLRTSPLSIQRSSVSVGGQMPTEIWDSAYIPLYLGRRGTLTTENTGGSGNALQLSLNAYNDGAWKYIGTGAASNLYETAGGFGFRSTGSGSAGGAITWLNLVTFASTGLVSFSCTDTAAGTTGAQTINKTCGSVNFAAAATSLVVTNSLITTTSQVQCTVGTSDTTMKSVACVRANGSLTISANAAATAETRVYFQIIGPTP